MKLLTRFVVAIEGIHQTLKGIQLALVEIRNVLSVQAISQMPSPPVEKRVKPQPKEDSRLADLYARANVKYRDLVDWDAMGFTPSKEQ